VSLERLGLQRTSTLDFPGRVAAVVFTMGCPLRCPYCHNPELVRGPIPSSFLSREEVMDFLKRRRPVLQGVAVTGGEPLLHTDLPDLAWEVAALGYPIKLDTTGFFPDRLRTVLDIPAVTCVAMDLKTLPELYVRVSATPLAVAGTAASFAADSLVRSMSILREWRDERAEGVDRQLEFRTTCAPGIVSVEELGAISSLLLEGDRWILNQFSPGNCLDHAYNTTTPYPPDVLLAVANHARSEGIHAGIRG
jgi:pyruvate formate lyase activating enzyme